MKKTLTAIALFTALAAGSSVASANPHMGHREGLQNYYYYFGAPCCDRPCGAPCGVASPCAAPCNPCAPCAPVAAPIEMASICKTTCCDPCNPCGGSFFGLFD